MKVKCIKIISSKDNRELLSSPVLTLNKTYLVLQLMKRGSNLYYYIIGDAGGCGAYMNAAQFEIVEYSIPSNWEVSRYCDGDFFLLHPRAWDQKGFLELLNDNDQEALAVFSREIEKIINECGE